MLIKVIVGMSGGVDSSITAYLLKQQGFDVEGVSFIMYEARMQNTFNNSPCCSLEAMKDAQKTAHLLGIKHNIIDLREEFIEKVIEPFVSSYSKGLTPNPCVLCNKYIKFPYLIKTADQKNAAFIATGHYAKTLLVNNQPLLMKASDIKKDQSYVLYPLGHDTLKRLLLPLSEKKKQEVKEIANKLNLPASKRKESQEICFIQNGCYCTFLDGIIEPKSGPIIDTETDKILGYHKGIHLFTIGQRKRLGIATGQPRYVIRIDAINNAVYIGTKEMAMQKHIYVNDINWLIPKKNSFKATIKIRSMMRDEPGTAEIIDNHKVKIIFDSPQWAPALGQSAVFYQEDVVIGGGIMFSLSSSDSFSETIS